MDINKLLNLQLIRGKQSQDVLTIIESHFGKYSNDALLIVNAMRHGELANHPITVESINLELMKKFNHPNFGRISYTEIIFKNYQEYQSKIHQNLLKEDKEKLQNQYSTPDPDAIWESSFKTNQIKAIEESVVTSTFFKEYSANIPTKIDALKLPDQLKEKSQKIRAAQHPEVLKNIEKYCRADSVETLLLIDCLKNGQAIEKPLSLEAVKIFFEDILEHPEFGKDSFIKTLLIANQKTCLEFQEAFRYCLSGYNIEYLEKILKMSDIDSIWEKDITDKLNIVTFLHNSKIFAKMFDSLLYIQLGIAKANNKIH